MSKESEEYKDPKEFRAEEKVAIVEEAIAAGKENVKEIAEKYELDPEILETWIRDKDVTYIDEPDHLKDDETVGLQVTDDFANDYEYGVTPDKLNYKTLFFWSIFGTAVIVLFIVSIFYVYDYTFQSFGQQGAETSLYYDINQLQENDRIKLSSFGVVDLDEGVYRMPIDSAISRLAEDSE